MGKRIAIAFFIVIVLVVGLGQLLSRFLLEEDKTPDVQTMQKASPIEKPLLVKDLSTVERINVISVEGKVDRRVDDRSWVAMRPGDELQQEDTIRTEQNGRAVLDVGKTATVEIEPRSQFSVQEVTHTVARVHLHAGRISAVVHGKEGSIFKVESKGSDAVAESDKGEFSVLTTGEGQVAVATRKGTVRLSARDKSVHIEAGKQSVVQPDLPPTAPQPIPSSLFLKVVQPRTTIQRAKNTTIKGTTTPGAFISINGVRVQTDETGQFSSTVELSEGVNPLQVEVEDASGNRRSSTLTPITVKSRVSTVQSTVGRWGTKRKRRVAR